MYETFFQLTRRPFTVAPQVESYVPNGYSEQALTNLDRLIGRGEGPALVIGTTGTGKTFLLQKLADTHAQQFRVAYLATARFASPRALLQNILYELGRPYRGMEEAELRLALTEYLLENDADPRPLLLLVDEAHTLSLRLLEEFRMITNLVRRGQPVVRLVMAGAAKLEEKFTNPKLDSLNQRIAARCYLESLNREDTTNYVRQQLIQAGGNPDRLVADDAYGAIYTATDGVPRLINQVCDQALLLAAVAGQSTLDAACVEEAWADLQQLPTPWNREQASPVATSGESSGVIEFGSLSNDSAAAASEEEFVPQEVFASPASEIEVASSEEPAEEQTGEDQPIFSYDTYLPGDPTIELENLRQSITDLSAEVQHATVTEPLPGYATSSGSLDISAEEEDFQPAGFVGPEVELVFHGPHHPFGETFAEEEVVIDHYASIEKSATERKVHDQSGQSNEIAAQLEQTAIPEPAAESTPSTPALAIHADHDSSPAPHDDSPIMEQPAAIDLPALTTQWEATDDEPVLPHEQNERSPAAQADGVEHNLAEPTPACRIAPRQSEATQGLTLDSDDRDIIIIEEEREAATAVASKPAGRVRRQEYRQLFARLRRGG